MLTLITFEPNNDHFAGFVEIESISNFGKNPEKIIDKGSKIYGSSLKKMRTLLRNVKSVKKGKRHPVLAKDIWLLGNAIFELKSKLENESLELNDLYSHLVRDLQVKRKWLEKVIIFRRYVSKMSLIPKSVNWGRFEKGTKRTAELLGKGLKLI